jgi:hypothetical protein
MCEMVDVGKRDPQDLLEASGLGTAAWVIEIEAVRHELLGDSKCLGGSR